MTPTKLLTRSRRKETLENNKQKVLLYLIRKTKWKRLYWKRPLEIKYLHIAKAKRLTYKQVRRAVDNLVREKKIERWTTYCRPNYKITYVRIMGINQ